MPASEDTHGPHAPDLEKTVCESDADRQGIHEPAATHAGAQPSSRGVATYHEFAAALIDIGLIDVAALERYAAGSADGVLGLSRALVKAGYLTPYQAAALYQNKSRGLLIGNYLILDKVGQGGMGMVFKARHRKLGRLGALKILPPSFTRDRGAVMRFRREFEAAAGLKHVNVVAAFEADEDRGVHYLVMDYVVGVNLDRIVAEQGPLPVHQALDYLIQSARGLEAAHEKGIIHRDIKPGNLMLDRAGTVRVLDLGLARIIDASNPFSKTVEGRITQSGTYMGSIDYMAPEQAEDAHAADHRADIYSLGCTFFFLLAGRAPFAGASMLKRMVAHQEHPAPSLRAVRSDVSPALEAAYQKMMAKKPEDRPASMAEVIALLQASKHSTATGAENVAPPSEPRHVAEVCNETPLKRDRTSQTITDSVMFIRRMESEGTLVDGELNLRDLVMDVRSEVSMTGEPSAALGERESACDDRELNLHELAMELREEAASPPTPKPRATAAQPLKRSSATHQAEALGAAPQPPPSTRPLKPAALPRQEQLPQAQPMPLASPQPLKPAAATRYEERPRAAPRPPAAPQPLKLAASLRQDDAPHAAPQQIATESHPPHPAALTEPGDSAPNKVLAILATLTAILVVVGVVMFLSRRPPAVVNDESPPPVMHSDETEHSSDAAPPPPL